MQPTYPPEAILRPSEPTRYALASNQMELLVDQLEQLKTDALEKRFELTAELQDIKEQLAELNEILEQLGCADL